MRKTFVGHIKNQGDRYGIFWRWTTWRQNMREIDKMYNDLLLLGYEPILLQSLTDKELKELWQEKNAKNAFTRESASLTT